MHPLIFVAGVNHGHGLRAEDPRRQVCDLGGLESGQVAAAGRPGVNAPLEMADNAVVADAKELPVGLGVLAPAAAGEDDGPAAFDHPADPGAERTLHADVIAARDVAAIELASRPQVDHGRTELEVVVGHVSRKWSQCWERAAEQVGAAAVYGPHLPVVGGVRPL